MRINGQQNFLSDFDAMNQGPTFPDVLIALLIAALCMAAVWISLFLKPVRPQSRKFFWILGGIFVLANQLLPLLLPTRLLMKIPVLYTLHPLLLLVILSVAEFFVLLKHTEEKRRLIGALALQSILILIFSWIFGSLITLIIAPIFY